MRAEASPAHSPAAWCRSRGMSHRRPSSRDSSPGPEPDRPHAPTLWILGVRRRTLPGLPHSSRSTSAANRDRISSSTSPGSSTVAAISRGAGRRIGDGGDGRPRGRPPRWCPVRGDRRVGDRRRGRRSGRPRSSSNVRRAAGLLVLPAELRRAPGRAASGPSSGRRSDPGSARGRARGHSGPRRRRRRSRAWADPRRACGRSTGRDGSPGDCRRRPAGTSGTAPARVGLGEQVPLQHVGEEVLGQVLRLLGA